MKVKDYSRTKNALLNFSSGTVSQLITLVLRFFVRTIFINTLGKEYLGIDGLFHNIMSMLTLTELGFGTAIVFKLYKPIALKDEERIRILIKFYRRTYLVIGFVVFSLGLILVPLLPFLIKDYPKLIDLQINVPLLFVLYLFQSASTYWFFSYTTVIVKASQKSYILYSVAIIGDIIKSLSQILILLFWKDYLAYIVVVIGFNFIQGVVNAYIAMKLFPYAFKKEKKSLKRDEVIGIIKDCGALFLNKMNGVTLKVCDNFVLSTFIGIAIVGLYSNYVILLAAISGLVGKFYSSMMAGMGNLFATSNPEKSYQFFETMNFSSILLYGTLGAFVFLVFDDIILAWIGIDYVIAQPCALLMGMEVLVNGLKVNLGQVRSTTGAFRQKWFRPVLGIIVNVAVSIALVKPFGICGVLAGTIIADVTTVLAVDPFVVHKYSFSGYKSTWVYYKKNLIYLLLLSIIILADYCICQGLTTGLPLVDIILHGLVCLVSIPPILLYLYRNTEYVKYIMGKGHSILRRKIS